MDSDRGVPMKLKPCVCGRKRIERWGTFDYDFYMCPKCGLRSHNSKTAEGAKREWNKLIDSLTNKDDVK